MSCQTMFSQLSVSKHHHLLSEVFVRFLMYRNKTLTHLSAVRWSLESVETRDPRKRSSQSPWLLTILTSELVVDGVAHCLRYHSVRTSFFQRSTARSTRGDFSLNIRIIVAIIIITITTNCLPNQKSGRQNYYCI